MPARGGKLQEVSRGKGKSRKPKSDGGGKRGWSFASMKGEGPPQTSPYQPTAMIGEKSWKNNPKKRGG